MLTFKVYIYLFAGEYIEW